MLDCKVSADWFIASNLLLFAPREIDFLASSGERLLLSFFLPFRRFTRNYCTQCQEESHRCTQKILHNDRVRIRSTRAPSRDWYKRFLLTRIPIILNCERERRWRLRNCTRRRSESERTVFEHRPSQTLKREPLGVCFRVAREADENRTSTSYF